MLIQFKNALQTGACAMVMATGLLVLPAAGAAAQQTQTAPDNTDKNKGSQDASQTTAGQSNNNKSDVQLARDIRRSVVKDKTLSTYAHNVKIIAQNGKVTLKGPVHSDEEKKTIETYAQKYAGDGNVDDQLTVKESSK